MQERGDFADVNGGHGVNFLLVPQKKRKRKTKSVKKLRSLSLFRRRRDPRWPPGLGRTLRAAARSSPVARALGIDTSNSTSTLVPFSATVESRPRVLPAKMRASDKTQRFWVADDTPGMSGGDRHALLPARFYLDRRTPEQLPDAERLTGKLDSNANRPDFAPLLPVGRPSSQKRVLKPEYSRHSQKNAAR
jgi:hypothetical protein